MGIIRGRCWRLLVGINRISKELEEEMAKVFWDFCVYTFICVFGFYGLFSFCFSIEHL